MTASARDQHDPLEDLDALLHLEATFHADGHALGVADGARAGRLEGRAFGLQRGFERFAAMGQLHGRAVVWSARVGEPVSQETTSATVGSASMSGDPEAEDSGAGQLAEKHYEPFMPRPANGNSAMDLEGARWRHIRPNPRLQKNVSRLYGLTEPESLSLENREDEVAAFEDRFKRARVKATIIGQSVGETVDVEAEEGDGGEDTSDGIVTGRSRELGIEDVDIRRVRH